MECVEGEACVLGPPSPQKTIVDWMLDLGGGSHVVVWGSRLRRALPPPGLLSMRMRLVCARGGALCVYIDVYV
jgi:hypothetical protein